MHVHPCTIALWLVFVCGACADDEVHDSVNAAQSGVTWTLDIAPLVADHCLGCHQQGGIAPFSMSNYASAKAWAGAMADAVEQRRMPPFLADETAECQPPLPWARDLRLTPEQKNKLHSWAHAGAPEGPPAARTQAAPPVLSALAREDVAKAKVSARAAVANA